MTFVPRSTDAIIVDHTDNEFHSQEQTRQVSAVACSLAPHNKLS